MKKILFILPIMLFLSACSVGIKNTNNTAYNYLSPKINFTYDKTSTSINLDSIESFTLKDSSILYSLNGTYNYYAYSKWINSPPNMLKDFILQSIGYIKLDPYARYRLKILLFNFEPHFDKDKFFYFKARAFLYNSSYQLLSNKIFEYKVEFTKNTNQAMVDSASKSCDDFLKDLNKWLLGEVKWMYL